MSTEVSPEIIKLTQESLGEFVKKPPLAEKLLKKPPFRFLHDIITGIQRSTGFFDGLFTEEELVSDNVKDRESKIAFLNKVIDVVNIVTDSSLSVRSSKIIAGLEPEKTNELLQQLGVALSQNRTNKPVIANTETSKKSIKKETKPPVSKNNESTKNDVKKPQTNHKQTVAKNNLKNTSNKVKTKPTDIKISKDKTKSTKSDTTSDSEKGSVKSNKSDGPIKSKIKAKPSTTKLKQPKSLEKQPTIIKTDQTQPNQNQIIQENEVTHGNRVELTDILDDSDELNSLEPDNKIENNNQVLKEKTETEKQPLSSNNNAPQPNEENHHETPVKSSTVERPRSRLSRQRNSLSSAVFEHENRNADGDHNRDSNTVPDVDFKIVNGIKGIHDDSIEAASEGGSGDSKTRNVGTASSRKNAKVKSEPLKASHSIISIENDNDVKHASMEIDARPQRPPSANLRPPSVRPSSARPGAPRLKEKNVDVIVTPSEPVVIGKVHVIVENYENQAEDDEGGVEVLQIAADDNFISADGTDTMADAISKGHGFLVQQILETQKELSHDEASKVEIEWEYGSRREREAAYKEIEGIRNGLQLLSRASNPLGKLMDYIQEDVEVMRQELTQWREARTSAAAELKQQQSLTSEQIQPLEAKLKQLEMRINEQIELTYTVKSNIHRNTQKIIKLVDRDE